MVNTSTRSDGRFLSGMFFRVLPAQIILLLLTGINNIVDGLVGSNFFGPTTASVIGLYAPFQTIWIGIGIVLMVGSQVLCARYMGSGNLQKIRGIFSLNITLTVAILSIATILSFTLASPIAAFLGASPVNAEALAGFIVGRGFGLIPMILASQLVAFLSLEGKDKINYFATSAMIVVNIGMDLFFAICFREMGIAGLGIATAISQWVYMIAAGWIFLTPKVSLSFSFRNILWKETWGLLKTGFPNALALFLLSIRSSTFNRVMGAYDPTMISVAVLATYTMLSLIFESFGKGIAAAGRIMTSLFYGEEDGRSIVKVIRIIFSKGMLIVLAASAASFLLADAAAGLFYVDPLSEAHQLTAMTMRYGSVVLFLQAVYFIFHDYFQAIGRNGIVNILSALEGIGFMLPPGLLLIPKMGVRGFMFTLIIAYALLALVGPVCAIIFWKRMPKTLSEWMMIPADFGAPENECMNASIHNLEEAVSTAEKVGRFCLERGIDAKKANCAALALEEMCLGIIKERFETDPKKKHTIELRAVHKGRDLFMSMKDDCRPFSPKDRAELVNPQDNSPKSLSIRVFMGVVKETEYRLILGMNVFTVTV